jgi:PAS domain S-box-containing protein
MDSFWGLLFAQQQPPPQQQQATTAGTDTAANNSNAMLEGMTTRNGHNNNPAAIIPTDEQMRASKKPRIDGPALLSHPQAPGGAAVTAAPGAYLMPQQQHLLPQQQQLLLQSTVGNMTLQGNMFPTLLWNQYQQQQQQQFQQQQQQQYLPSIVAACGSATMAPTPGAGPEIAPRPPQQQPLASLPPSPMLLPSLLLQPPPNNSTATAAGVASMNALHPLQSASKGSISSVGGGGQNGATAAAITTSAAGTKRVGLPKETAQERRRKRNMITARRSRERKRNREALLQLELLALRRENEGLRGIVKSEITAEGAAQQIIGECCYEPFGTVHVGRQCRQMRWSDFEMIEGLSRSHKSFCLTDPRLPDNPIVYASAAFLELTGYPREQVVGRNCRFLQGPETDPRAVRDIHDAIDSGKDGAAFILNYAADGTPFWNQFFIAPLRDREDRIVNFVRRLYDFSFGGLYCWCCCMFAIFFLFALTPLYFLYFCFGGFDRCVLTVVSASNAHTHTPRRLESRHR